MDDLDEYFLVQSGVHRSVAAYRLELVGILAWIFRQGRPAELRTLKVNRLHSSKTSIHRWDHNRDFHELVRIMSSAEGRLRMPPIEVVPVSDDRRLRYPTIAEVLVEGEYDE